MKTAYILAVLLLIAIVGCAKQNTQENVIKIGYVGGLTGSYAFYGEDELRTINLAVNEINEQGGINGRKIVVIPEDGACEGQKAVTAAQKLIAVDGVKIILGGSCSSETLAMAPVTESAGVLLFTSTSTSPDVTSAGDLVFRNSPSDVDGARATADLAWKNGVRSIAIITENKDFPQGFKKIFIERFTELGGNIVLDENFQTDSTDFRTIITKTQSVKPNAVLIASQGPTGGRVVKQLREAGYDGPLYGNVILSGTEILEQYGSYVDGLYYSDTAGLDPLTNAKAAAYLDKFNTTYDKKPSYDFYTGARYDSVFIIADGLRQVGDDPAKLKEYLYTLPSYDGVIGKYRFDNNGDVVGLTYKTYQIVNGTVREIA